MNGCQYLKTGRILRHQFTSDVGRFVDAAKATVASGGELLAGLGPGVRVDCTDGASVRLLVDP
jgi:hypothetical protein